ncbi:MAG TPA: FMN-binding negative transcriptional regulator [Burkholderiaceae bacterium]|nr:FMN-binding negative transcriptional regulator [Burkholderiaceae bacterium]
MYLPEHFAEHDVPTLHALIRAHPLATLVTAGADELVVNHVPLLLDAGNGPFGTLRGHVARANPVWKQFSPTLPTVAVFQGADAYITPSWYPSKAEHGKVVPTWNYAVVHAHGVPRVIEDPAWLLALVSDLTRTHETAIGSAWTVGDAPGDYIEQMLRAIVGIEMPVATLRGKWKASQNRLPTDRAGVARGLAARSDAAAQEMATLVRRPESP